MSILKYSLGLAVGLYLGTTIGRLGLDTDKILREDRNRDGIEDIVITYKQNAPETVLYAQEIDGTVHYLLPPQGNDLYSRLLPFLEWMD